MSVNCMMQLQAEGERHFINQHWNAASFPPQPHLLNSFIPQEQELSTPTNQDLIIKIMTQFAAVSLSTSEKPISLQQTSLHFRHAEEALHNKTETNEKMELMGEYMFGTDCLFRVD